MFFIYGKGLCTNKRTETFNLFNSIVSCALMVPFCLALSNLIASFFLALVKMFRHFFRIIYYRLFNKKPPRIKLERVLDKSASCSNKNQEHAVNF